MSKKQLNVINLVLKEAKAYTSIDLIESYISKGESLEHLPVQPLYVTFKNLPLEVKSHALSLLSKEQRTIFYDLDLWTRDSLDINSFSALVETVAKSPLESIRYEFTRSSEFALFLKGRFNIWTFDVEDPLYPDHDYYFLTEDNLLLFEYDEECEIVDEAKQLVRDLYSDLGVEAAYQYLFTIVSEGNMDLSEKEYQAKKERLRDFGFVDYIDALESLSSFPSLSHIEFFVKKKEPIKSSVSTSSMKQTLHANSLIAFENEMFNLSDELSKIENEKRFEFLHFNFVRLLNANFEKEGVLKDGPLAMTRVGKKVRNALALGVDYINSIRNFEDEGLFHYFDFVDVFRIGNSLTSLVQKRLKKELASFELDEFDDSFLGKRFERFLDGLFDYEVKGVDKSGEYIALVRLMELKRVQNTADLLVEMLPFIKELKTTLATLIRDGQIQGSYYLNYDEQSIDLEAILISLVINFYTDKLQGQKSTVKMGVTIKELKLFASEYMDEDQVKSGHLSKLLEEFSTHFGLNEIDGISEYLLVIIGDQIGGYVFKDLTDMDFKHIGGPIIFNNLS